MLSNKKGMSWSLISKFIFALIVIGIIFILYLNVGDFLYGAGSKAACQNWVYRNSVSYVKEIAGSLEASPCITTEEVIKKVKDKDDLYEKIARNMYDCWDQYGQGESNFYSDLDWGPSNLYCRVCSEIKFDDEVKRSFKEIDIDDFEVYLSSNNPPNHKETYADFFTKAENSKLDFGSGKISLEQNLYTMFTAYKAGDYSLQGFFDKLVLTPGAIFLGGSLTPGVKKIPKGIGGLISFDKTTVTTVAKTTEVLKDASGKPIPYLEKIITKTPVKLGTGWALAIIYVGVAGTAFLADGSVLYPTLMIISSDSPEFKGCDAGIYYNPEKKPLDVLKKDN